MTTIACLLIPCFAIAVERQRHPELRARPLILVPTQAGRGQAQRVLEASPEAAARGVVPGMALRRATLLCPEAHLLEPDLLSYQRQFQRIIEALLERAPEVEPGSRGEAYVRLDGLEGLYHDEHALALALLRAAPEVLEPRLGIAPNKFVARVLASRLPPGRVVRLRRTEELEAFLSPLPVATLPVSAEVLERLARFGLRTLADLARLPLGPVQSQFGREGARLWSLARGEDDEPLVPCQPRETVEVTLAFPAPAGDVRSLTLALEHLVDRLLAHPQVAGRCLRRTTIVAHLERGGSCSREVVFKQVPLAAGRDRRRMLLSACSRWLEGGLPGAVEALTLVAEELSGEVGHQMSLFREQRPDRGRGQLQEALQQLRARYGPDLPVYSIVEVEPWSRIPERRWALAPYTP